MPSIDEIEYSHDETISAIRDYYQFLSKLYLDKSNIAEPPEGGWSNITPELMKKLNKTDEVTQLLRNLPYIKPIDGQRIHAVPWTSFVDWDYEIEDFAKNTDFNDISHCEGCLDDIPPHVIGLTAGCGPDESIFLLDTQLGVIYFHAFPWINTCREPIQEDPFEYGPEDEEWRREGVEAWSIPDFFEVLKDQFRKLRYLPRNTRQVNDTFEKPHRVDALIQEIYRAHGWPDLDLYRKDECLRAISDLMDQPNVFDNLYDNIDDEQV
jgi:hypothetical protein